LFSVAIFDTIIMSVNEITDFLTKYLQEEKDQQRSAQSSNESNGDSGKRSFARLMSSYKNNGGIGSMDAFSMLMSSNQADDFMDIGSTGKAFSYASVPVVMRNRLKEVNQSHKMKMKDIPGEVFDWIFTHLESKSVNTSDIASFYMKNALLSPSVCMSQNNLLRLYKS
jgi:hypothetical protein